MSEYETLLIINSEKMFVHQLADEGSTQIKDIIINKTYIDCPTYSTIFFQIKTISG